MKENALEQYTKQKNLYGQNDEEILYRFIQYANQCSDPMNIYNYMKEKSICIYLPNFWINQAHLLSDTGEFKDALFCLKEATSRDHIINEDEINMNEHLEKIKRKIITAMKRKPPQTKRSATEYNFMYETEVKATMENLETLVELFEKNYSAAKKEIEEEFSLKMYGKNKSWLAPIEEQKQENYRKISERIKSIGNQDMFYSMRTPISKKEPMRLTKAMDSVEMLKRKKGSTSQKFDRRSKIFENETKEDNSNHKTESENDESLNEKNFSKLKFGEDFESICMNTAPVGGRVNASEKRKVTFNATELKQVENFGGSNENMESNRNLHSEQIEQSKSLPRKGSILKNKRTSSYIEMNEEN